MEPGRLHVDIFVPPESADSVCVCPAGRKQDAETQSSKNQRRKRRRRKARQDKEGGRRTRRLWRKPAEQHREDVERN